MKATIEILITLIIAALIILLAGCENGTWSTSVTADHDTTEIGAMFSPDPNGGVGFKTMTNTVIAEDTWDNVAVGPAIEFRIDDIVNNTTDRVFPGNWDLENVPIETFGTMALLWNFECEEILFLPGIETRFKVTPYITPILRVEYREVEGVWSEEGLYTTFGARYEF